MRSLPTLLLTLCLTSLAHAEDTPRHNTLTSKEAAEGWLLLFDGETTFGWQSPNGSKWNIADGMLAPQAGKHGLLVTTTAFTDYDLRVQYRMRNTTQAAVFVGCDRDGHGAEKLTGASEGEKPVEKRRPDDVTPPPPEFRPREVSLRAFGDRWMEARIEVRNGILANSSYASADQRTGFGFASKRPREKQRPGRNWFLATLLFPATPWSSATSS